MGRFFDLLLSNSWEEYQRIQLEKSIKKLVDKLSEDELDGMSKAELIKLLKKEKV